MMTTRAAWIVTIASGCAGTPAPGRAPPAPEPAQSRPAPTAASSSAERPPPLPPASAFRVQTAEPPKSAYLREEDIVFRPRAGAATVRLVERGRSMAWFGPKGVMATSSGSTGSILAGGRVQRLAIADGFEVTFSPDGARASIVQARAPLSVVDVAAAKILWRHERGLGCAARWANATTLVAHDDSLLRVDLAAEPPVARQLGVARRADECWASSDGKRWLVRDDLARKVVTKDGHERYHGVVWRVDGETGAASVVLEDASDVMGTAAADRLCYTRDGALLCRAIDGPEERIADDAAYPQLDETGRTLVYSTRGVFFAADLRDKTVRALSGVTGHSGGVVAVLSGGDFFATGSASGVEVFDLRTKTKLVIPGGSFYGVRPVPGRPRALFIQKERSDHVTNDLFVAELPP
jgi:hypothetical protein